MSAGFQNLEIPWFWKNPLYYDFQTVFTPFKNLIFAHKSNRRVELDMRSQKEWWVQRDIIPEKGNWRLNDDILLKIHKEFLPNLRQKIKSWHFFREPQLRFRIEFKDKKTRDDGAVELEGFLDSLDIIEDHYLANHDKKVEKLEDGYKGEIKDYKRMWSFQKKLWEWGSKMAIEAIKEFKETGKNDPPREYQLERIFHLLYNQLNAQSNPLSLNEVEMYQRCANNRLLTWAYQNSQKLDEELLKKIKKK